MASKTRTQEEIYNDGCLKIDTASLHIKDAYKLGMTSKLKYLPDWCNYKSKMLLEEQQNNNVKVHYPKYKRGQIVYINFGVNIGSELSGNHFAVVINKKDHEAANTVVVVPLTSKKGKNVISMGNIVVDILLPAIIKNKNFQDIGNQTANFAHRVESLKSELIKLRDEFVHNPNILNMVSDVQKRIKEIEGEQKELENEIFSFLSKKEEDFEMIKIISKRYSHLSQNISYANVNYITQISKTRIYPPKNIYDPISNVVLSNDALNEIDKAIIEKFTNFTKFS